MLYLIGVCSYNSTESLLLNRLTIIHTNNPTHSWYGAAWKIAAFACYAGLNGIARYLSGGADTALTSHLPVGVVVFSQDVIALCFLLPWILKYRPASWVPSHLGMHLFRVITSALGIITWYFVLRYMPLAEAVALSVIGPLFGVIGAKWLLGEKFGLTRAVTIVLTLVGACFLLQPAHALEANMNNQLGLVFLLISTLSFAMAKLATRRLAQYGETAMSLTTYLFLMIVPVSFLPAALDWVTPELVHLPWLLLAGGLTALAVYCVSNALVYAEVSFLAPFDICQFILNTIVGYLAFMELPAPWAFWLVLAFILFSFTARKVFNR